MPLPYRKPERRTLKLTDMVQSPQHDQPCRRIPYSDSKSLFEMLLKEATDG